MSSSDSNENDDDDDDDSRCTTDDDNATGMQQNWVPPSHREYTKCDSGAMSLEEEGYGCSGLTRNQPAGKGKSFSGLFQDSWTETGIEPVSVQESREGMIQTHRLT